MTALDLHGRSFLKELDFTIEEWQFLLDLARDLKRERAIGVSRRRLDGLNIALVFEKASTRTRCAFEVAAHHEGAHVTYLDPDASHLGHKESVADTARVLGRMYDGIEYRGFAQQTVETLAEYAGVPVWNGLTDEWHPTQSLCDMLTMTEHSAKAPGEISFAYVGDGRNNVANSLIVAGSMMGMDVRLVAPTSLQPSETITTAARTVAVESGARLTLTGDVAEGVRGVDFVYTDVWVSMGESPEKWEERLELLAPYQVDERLMALTGNPETRFMHCLPALHSPDTDVGGQIFRRSGRRALEVTDEVFESKQSVVFDQAENRMHTIKAVMVATLGR
jgi:ornithine carbamoyltransferase